MATNTGQDYITLNRDGYYAIQVPKPGGGRSRTRRAGIEAAIACRDALEAALPAVLRRPEPGAIKTLRFTPHRDDYSDPGPKKSTVGRKVGKQTRGEHKAIHAVLSESNLLRPGDEIKTSRDSLRDILGATAHMHITALETDGEVGRLFIAKPVDSVVRSYISTTFGVEIVEVKLPEAA